ncbi:hypothetical protein GEMRC1_002400 [Eukaryota sp. GEM-RC1]
MLTDSDIESLSLDAAMFCYQCEQASKSKGCSYERGVCSKPADLSALFDLLIAGAFSLAVAARPIVEADGRIPDTWTKVLSQGCFLTLTNVNFDLARVKPFIDQIKAARDEARQCLTERNLTPLSIDNEFGIDGLIQFVNWEPAATVEEQVKQGREFGIIKRLKANKATVTGLQEMLVYAIKGMSAYSTHIAMLKGSIEADGVAIVKTLSDIIVGERDLLELALEFGKANLDTMSRLDEANTSNFGVPNFSKVSFGVKKGHCILMSGHDLHDLHSLLEATKDIPDLYIYTHGEMLAANAYPEFQKYAHFAGNFGSAWQLQRKEFPNFLELLLSIPTVSCPLMTVTRIECLL